MYEGNLVVEGTCHTYHISEENALNPQAVGTGNGLFEIINNLHPDGYELPPEKWFKDDTAQELAELMWLETDIDIARYQSTKLTDYFADGMNRLDTGLELREEYGDFRIPSVLGSVNPLADDALEEMERQVKEENVDGFKLYPAFFKDGETLDTRLDNPDMGVPIIEKAVDLGVPHIAVHKSIPYGQTNFKQYDVGDVEHAASMFPEVTFEVVHAGLSFLDETKFLLQRYPNVWANLEVTSFLVAESPMNFAEVLAELLVWGGPERIVWSTGPTAIHPQPIIEAFWEFQFPDMLLENGVPPLTDEIKRMILGENALRMMDKDPDDVRSKLMDIDDKVARLRVEQDERPDPWASIKPTGASEPMQQPRAGQQTAGGD
ncbi:MAG: amidohydrolase family protein [Halobacteriales archaeon]